MSAPAPERRVTVGGGVALHVRTWDGGDRVPFLLVHGLSSNCRTWEGVAARLFELGHPVATVDLRGHGRSDKPDDGYDFATLCADLVVVARAVGFRRAIVAGQSTGGNLAVELAARAPELVAGVAGVDGGAIELSRRWPEWDACLATLAPPRLTGLPVEALEARLRSAHPSWSDWAIEATLANLELLPDGTVRPWLTYGRHLLILRSLWEHRPSAVLPGLDVPVVLVLASAGDGAASDVQSMAEAVVSGAPKVQVEWIVGDHDLHVQFPDRLAELLSRSF